MSAARPRSAPRRRSARWGPTLRCPRFYIARRARAHLFGKRITLESGEIVEPDRQTGRQAFEARQHRWAHRIEVRDAGSRHGLAQLDHPPGPGIQCRVIAGPKDRIALLHAPNVVAQGVDVVVFHVKHAPVDPLTPVAGSAEHQLGQVRQQQLHGQQSRDHRRLPDRLSVQAQVRLVGTLLGEADAYLPAHRVGATQVHRQYRLVVPDEGGDAPAPKGPAADQQVQGLQQGRLARAVGPDQQIQPRGEIERGRRDVPDIADLNVLDDHVIGASA